MLQFKRMQLTLQQSDRGSFEINFWFKWINWKDLNDSIRNALKSRSPPNCLTMVKLRFQSPFNQPIKVEETWAPRIYDWRNEQHKSGAPTLIFRRHQLFQYPQNPNRQQEIYEVNKGCGKEHSQGEKRSLSNMLLYNNHCNSPYSSRINL